MTRYGHGGQASDRVALNYERAGSIAKRDMLMKTTVERQPLRKV